MLLTFMHDIDAVRLFLRLQELGFWVFGFVLWATLRTCLALHVPRYEVRMCCWVFLM